MGNIVSIEHILLIYERKVLLKEWNLVVERTPCQIVLLFIRANVLTNDETVIVLFNVSEKIQHKEKMN